MPDYEKQIRSQRTQLLTWEQYRDLLIDTLNAADYPNLEDKILSEFNYDYFINAEFMIDWILPLFSPHESISNELRSTATLSCTDFLFNLLFVINRTRNLVENGRFNANTDGWSDGSSAGGSMDWNSDGYLEATYTSGNARANYEIQWTPGKLYQVSLDVVEEPVGGHDVFIVESTAVNIFDGPALGYHSVLYRATQTDVTFSARQFSEGVFGVDNVTIRQLEA